MTGYNILMLIMFGTYQRQDIVTCHVEQWIHNVCYISVSIFYMTPYNILTLMCTKHYEAIVLHDTLKYHDTDVYQTLWNHCSTWHVTISWRWCVPNNMKPLSYMTRYNIQMLMCTKHYEAIVLCIHNIWYISASGYCNVSCRTMASYYLIHISVRVL
jgi:hypothetical protein